ncbi:MAG: hypothetical protein AB7S38_15760 [Vulcanimicrobiota bacterium]
MSAAVQHSWVDQTSGQRLVTQRGGPWGGEWVYLQRIAARGADDPPDDSWSSGRSRY